ncbi:MAG: hypothetical protein ACI4T7_05700, partial [Alloprevotella sp.]
NFPQVRNRYIFLIFQNSRESRSVKIANGKITLCAESGAVFTVFCKCLSRQWLRCSLSMQIHLQLLSVIGARATEVLAAVISEKGIVGGNQHHGNLFV